jgi:hypothetical protein
MIESGVKTEEYREIKPYWAKRLCITRMQGIFSECENSECCECLLKDKVGLIFSDPITFYRKYDIVTFRFGYTQKTMSYIIDDVVIGKGNPEWGAPTEEVFIIKLGKRVC